VVKAEGTAKPTRILYGANLSHERLTKYLEELEVKGLLRHDVVERGSTRRGESPGSPGEEGGERSTYHITPEGDAFLGEYAKLKRFTDAYGLEL
jgi:predicted transcriptional regulator